MRKFIVAMTSLAAIISPAFALEYSGRANTWFLYQTDSTASTTVAVVKDSNGVVLGIAVGNDIATECAVSGRTCEYRQIGSDGELDLVRETGSFPTPTTENQGKIGGDTFLSNLGIDAKGSQNEWSGKIQGNFTTSWMENRALLGHERYRFRFNQLNIDYAKPNYHLRVGRQVVSGGNLLDGVSGDYFFGPSHAADTKSVGFFAGLSPDPISKNPSMDFMSFGPKLLWIPEFSGKSEAKLLTEAAIVTELFKGSVNRFYLHSKVHFSPIREFSSTLYSNLELPWVGENASLASSLLSFQNFWRPSNRFTFSIGFSQFQIDRHLQEEGIRWVTDNGSQQSTRVSDTLDRSQRYRFDTRLSYKIIPQLQPYLRARYERRTFDSNKVNLNTDSGTPLQKNTYLLNQKNAYQGSVGTKIYLFDHLEADTSATYGQRYQSKFYSLYQSTSWESGNAWMIDGYIQYVWSRRTQDASVPNQSSDREVASDYYAGVGGSYRFLTDFLGQIRYDLGNEDDQVLGSSVLFHTLYLRLDYKF